MTDCMTILCISTELRWGLVRTRQLIYCVAACGLLGCESSQDRLADAESAISRYCVDCHNGAERAGGLTLESRDLAALAADP
jgi:hypothetical protein